MGKLTCDDTLLKRGFVQVPVIILQAADLSAGAKLTYGLLLWYIWKDKDYPGHQRAAKEFSIPRASLCRYLSELEDKQLIKTTRPGLGETNSYHLPDPRLILRLQESQGEISDVSNRDTKGQDFKTLDLKDEDESLSLALEISEAYGTTARDRKALMTSLSKYPAAILQKVKAAMDKRLGEGDVENPGAYANRLAQVFDRAESEDRAAREQERSDLFDMILSSAAFEYHNGRAPERVREILLGYWPAELGLVEKALQLVVGKGD